MSISANEDKTFALAGIAQAGKIITQLAAEPKPDEVALDISLEIALRASAESLLNTTPDDIQTVFDGVDGVRLGLSTMQSLLRGQGMAASLQAKEMVRYMMSMDQLAVRLAQSISTQEMIGNGIEEIRLAFDSFLSDEDEDDNETTGENETAMDEASLQLQYDALYERIALLYQKSLSQLPPKIMVRGAQGSLRSEKSIARVRTALFAGVRAAYLWRQQGGRRWHLLFARKAYAEIAQKLQAHI